MTAPAARSLQAGWRELGQAQWAAARERFAAALAAEETPEALEGLSWATWWLDDGEAVLAARERAHRLYRERGDAPAAARMAIWSAADELDFHGAAAVAQGWLQRAHRLLDGLEPGPEHGWLAFHEGYLAHLADDGETARTLAIAATDCGRRCGVADLEMLGLALEGATLVSCAQVEDGMRRLDEATATALAGEATIPISSAWTCCFLVGACTAALDFERAAEWTARIAAFAERYGSRYMLAFCRAEYGAVHLWQGRWGEAEALLEASVEDFARARPAFAGGPLALLAELRRRQSRPDEASALLERAGASTRALLCRARLALDAGEALRAAELLERQLRRLPAERGLARAPALELLVEARAAQGELDAAQAALAQLRAVQAQAATSPLRACADRAAGLLACAHGDFAGARTLLEDAVDGLERAGAAYEAARARLALAACLRGLGRAAEAADEARSALERLGGLGAELDAQRARALLDAGERPPPPDGLTPREREVLHLLAGGLTNRQIAQELVVSEHTVHRHVANLLRKLDLPSRSAAAAHAVRSGLV